VLIDAISGVSGAGRNAKAENLFVGVDSNVRAYRVGTHQHTPEIEQELGGVRPAGSPPVTVLFVPHVGPYRDGIMANCYLRPAKAGGITDARLHELLLSRYAQEPFVRVLEPGSLPQVQPVLGTNFCDIGATFDPRTGTVVVISVTDNLVKGAAGQAVQNMNLMFGFDEGEGIGPRRAGAAG
jgi:N-acetyl-gamma-glutamyl-phosphate reductase